MQGKLLFQKYFHSGKGWKDPLSTEEIAEWNVWTKQIPEVAKLSIPRWFGTSPAKAVVMHVFSDASEMAYGAVIYFVTREGGRTFVAGKGRVVSRRRAPPIVRLELQAFLLGVRLAESTAVQLAGYVKILRIICWTDSVAVFCWYYNQSKEYRQFVANRLTEVFEAFDRLQENAPEVRWVPTKQNPADLISRGCDQAAMTDQFDFWARGPEFLSETEDKWPTPPAMQPNQEEDLVKARIIAASFPKYDKYAEFDNLESYVKATQHIDKPTVRQLESTEHQLIIRIQKCAFSAERKELEDRKKAARTDQPVSVFFRRGFLKGKEVFLDDSGYLRLVTRLAQADWMPWATRCPIILSIRHPAASLLVRSAHERALHEGARTTYAELSKKYWMPFNVVKSEVFRCKICRESKPLRLDAPVGRLQRSRLQPWTTVFHETGMDFFGPFMADGRKVWGLLFTCFNTRAVHIELVRKVAVADWLNALERFMSRRGKPAAITSDNGSTFTAGNKILQKMLEEFLTTQFKGELTEAVRRRFGIRFKFIPVGTPHYGGLWENLVRKCRTAC
jgi:Pao retrotransposon peptidase./Integrase core domain.